MTWKPCLSSRWAANVKSAVLHVISLGHYAIEAARGWAANSINARVRLTAENDQLKQEVQLLREELRIKDAPDRAFKVGGPLHPGHETVGGRPQRVTCADPVWIPSGPDQGPAAVEAHLLVLTRLPKARTITAV